MTATPLIIPTGYGLVLLSVCIIAFQVFTSSIPINGLRGKFFNKEFYLKHFPQWKGKIASQSGYPDMGHGRIADKLTDEEWYQFGCAQRAHYAAIETAFPIILNLLISGLYFTRFTFISSIIYIIGRELYSIGYRRNGPKGRLIGVLLVDVTLIITLGTAIYTGYTLGGGIEQIKLFFQP